MSWLGRFQKHKKLIHSGQRRWSEKNTEKGGSGRGAQEAEVATTQEPVANRCDWDPDGEMPERRPRQATDSDKPNRGESASSSYRTPTGSVKTL